MAASNVAVAAAFSAIGITDQAADILRSSRGKSVTKHSQVLAVTAANRTAIVVAHQSANVLPRAGYATTGNTAVVHQAVVIAANQTPDVVAA